LNLYELGEYAERVGKDFSIFTAENLVPVAVCRGV